MINVAKISEVDAQIECSKVSLYIYKISDLIRKDTNSKKDMFAHKIYKYTKIISSSKYVSCTFFSFLMFIYM